MKRYIILMLFVLGLVTSCEDFIDLEPNDQISNDVVITNEADAVALVLGGYSDYLQDGDSYSELEIGMNGLLSDELVHTGSFPTYTEFNRNEVGTQNVDLFAYWDNGYEGTFAANFLLENIGSLELADTVENGLRGEALWLRALAHFNLTKIFGDVPLALTSDLETLSSLSRTSQPEVLNQVMADLNEAATLLQGVNEGNKNRAGEWAAKALAARVELFRGNVSQAGVLATEVINSDAYSLENNYIDVFNGGSNEVIFEVFADANDQSGIAFFFLEDGRYEYAPSSTLIDSYEPGDSRLSIIGATSSGQPMGIKYTDVATGTDQPIVLRLAEMYLIQAEANVGSPTGDTALNTIRSRAGLEDVTNANLENILNERFREFAFEGLRWYDLTRTGTASAVLSPIKSDWDDTDVLLPIPQQERDQNGNLSQNPGY